MFAIVVCLVLLICTFTIRSYVLCVLMVQGMSVLVNVMLSLTSVMSLAPNDTTYKRWSCHSSPKMLCKLCQTLLVYLFFASQSCRSTGWLVLLLTKAGDVETNPDQTISYKRVWIHYICYK